LEDSENAAWCIRDELTSAKPDGEKLKRCLEVLKANCKSCHRAYRDNE
jgi:cytochrome c556